MQSDQTSQTRTELSKAEYMALRSKLDFSANALPNLGIVLLDILLLVASAMLLRQAHWATYALSQLLLAIVFFNSFSLLHECGHASSFSSASLNALLGLWSSTFCFFPFYPWKYIHQKHHAWTGNIDRDPVARALLRWREVGVPPLVRFSWRSWLPLVALVQHVIFVTYPYQLWRSKELTRSKLIRTLISLLWLPVAWWALHRLAPDVVRVVNLVPALILFLFAEELVNTPHHVDLCGFEHKLPVWEHYRASRSCYYPAGVSELLVLNFNFHTEHHLFPSLPWYRLRRARGLVRATLGERYQEAVGLQWNRENRSRDLQLIVDRYTNLRRRENPSQA